MDMGRACVVIEGKDNTDALAPVSVIWHRTALL